MGTAISKATNAKNPLNALFVATAVDERPLFESTIYARALVYGQLKHRSVDVSYAEVQRYVHAEEPSKEKDHANGRNVYLFLPEPAQSGNKGWRGDDAQQRTFKPHLSRISARVYYGLMQEVTSGWPTPPLASVDFAKL